MHLPNVYAGRNLALMVALQDRTSVSVCETCAERGRPNEPVYKLGMCEFCYKGLRHPKASSEQLARERLGVSHSTSAAAV